MLEDIIIGIQNLPVSVWIREAFWPFPVILALHISGMALLAGTGVVTSLRVLGVAPAIPLSAMNRFWPAAWLGLTLAMVSGIALFMSYPAKAITNIPFFPKLVILTASVILWRIMARRLIADPANDFAKVSGRWKLASLAVIAGLVFVIAAGRLLAYTYDSNNLLWYHIPAGGF